MFVIGFCLKQACFLVNLKWCFYQINFNILDFKVILIIFPFFLKGSA